MKSPVSAIFLEKLYGIDSYSYNNQDFPMKFLLKVKDMYNDIPAKRFNKQFVMGEKDS